MLKVYGLKNCDTCAKALRWLDAKGIAHRFVDLREEGTEKEQLAEWAEAVGWEKLLNRRSTTWRELDDADKEGLDEAGALRLMTDKPTLVKRPVFEGDGQVLVGFDAQTRETLQEAYFPDDDDDEDEEDG